MTNSADPDQLASSLQKPTDLDLHCLQRQGTWLDYELHHEKMCIQDICE